MLETDDFIKAEDAKTRESFRRYMADPRTKIALSTLPPSENLEDVLFAFFEAGKVTGITRVLTEIFKSRFS